MDFGSILVTLIVLTSFLAKETMVSVSVGLDM